MSDDLKPCPFCGAQPRISRDPDHNAFDIWCDATACGGCPNTGYGDLAEVSAAWNTRPVEDALRARAEAAEAQLAEMQAMRITHYDVESRAQAAEFKLALVPWDAIAAVCDALTHLPPVPDGDEYLFPIPLIRSINMVLAWLADRPAGGRPCLT